MEKKQDFEWIEDVTKQFRKLKPAELEDGATYRWWLLRLLLCIAQQTSVISNRLKEMK
jgi:hypothetical protein